MGKAKSTFINMFLTLLVVCVLAGAALAALHRATDEPIQETRLTQQQEAIEKVLPPFDSLQTEKKALEAQSSTDIYHKTAAADSLTLYHAFLKGIAVGTAVESFTNKGFGGTIKLMVGFLPDGKVYKTAVLSHTETPGLGSKMTEPSFYTQFEGMQPEQFPLQVQKDGGEVQAITAATISSRAYCDAMNTAFDAIKK
ncbi:MAG: RnfABCDGE type electron transport complex subunit G [Bacteroidales bacterium]|nr:RnfABCDGE type electron transport complex subunit G [Bacteroidales bacterium]